MSITRQSICHLGFGKSSIGCHSCVRQAPPWTLKKFRVAGIRKQKATIQRVMTQRIRSAGASDCDAHGKWIEDPRGCGNLSSLQGRDAGRGNSCVAEHIIPRCSGQMEEIREHRWAVDMQTKIDDELLDK